MRCGAARTSVQSGTTLVDRYGFEGRDTSVRRFVGRVLETALEQTGIVDSAPGKAAQVGDATGPKVRDTANGQHERTRHFVPTLSYAQIRQAADVSFGRSALGGAA